LNYLDWTLQNYSDSTLQNYSDQRCKIINIRRNIAKSGPPVPVLPSSAVSRNCTGNSDLAARSDQPAATSMRLPPILVRWW